MVVWLYIVWFLAGVVFTLGIFAGSFYYVYRHKEKYAQAFIRNAMSSAMDKARADS